MRFVIDTCVFSEMLRARPAPSVASWIDRFLVHTRLCSPVYMEIEKGIALEADESIRAVLKTKSDRLLNRFDAGDWLLFDRAAAASAGRLLADARRTGRPIGVVDAQIIGIAALTQCAVVTRDADFSGRGVAVVNPWLE